MKLSKRIFLVGMMLAVAAIVGAVWAYAENGFDIRACYNNSSGVLRIVKDVSECRDQETELEWNIQGIQGPPGPTGGVLGFYTKTSYITGVSPGEKDTEVCCDAEDTVSGGGFRASQACVKVYESRPKGDQRTWKVRIYNECSGSVALEAYVICADFDPPH